MIYSRTRERSTSCPICKNRIICPVDACNSLAMNTNFSFLLEEWNYERNEKDPNSFASASGAKIWWKCS